MQGQNKMSNEITLNEELEDGMYDAQPIEEAETLEEFEQWCEAEWQKDGFGYIQWAGETYAKSDARKNGDWEMYRRVGNGWAKH
jgi:hypothetical protein